MEFLQTKARFDVVSRAFQLDELDLVRVVSLTSYGRFDPHMSWNVRFGALRMEDAGCHCVGGRFAIGGGAAKSWMNDGLTLFTTLQTQVISAPDLHGIAGIPLRVGVGPSIGARWRISDRLVALATAELLWQPQQDPVTALTIAGTLRWQAAQALAFDLAVTHERGSTACVLQTMIYF